MENRQHKPLKPPVRKTNVALQKFLPPPPHQPPVHDVQVDVLPETNHDKDDLKTKNITALRNLKKSLGPVPLLPVQPLNRSQPQDPQISKMHTAFGKSEVEEALLPACTTTFSGDDDGVKDKVKFVYDCLEDLHRVCGKVLTCGHFCEDPLFWRTSEKSEPACGMCRAVVDFQRACGHTVAIYCGRRKPAGKCQRNCDKTLVCGHPCELMCGDPLCGLGTCGSAKCNSNYPREHAEFEKLRPSAEVVNDDEGW